MTQRPRTGNSGVGWLLLVVWAALISLIAGTVAGVEPATAAGAHTGDARCTAGVDLYGFSDALDKQTFEGTNVGGISVLTYDQHRGVY